MSGIRRDPVRAVDALYVAERIERPNDFGIGPVARCPFCPGHEADTGAPLRDEGAGWRQRVVANRFPALTASDGEHEIVIESREHDFDWSTASAAEIAELLHVYAERERAALLRGTTASVSLYRNRGARSGASLAHPHGHVLVHYEIPTPLDERLRRARASARCATCAGFDDVGGRLVEIAGDVLAYVPDVCRTACEIHVAPRTHAARLSALDARAIDDVAALAGDAVRRLTALFGPDLPYNVLLGTATHDVAAERALHWALEIVPRRDGFGGYELATGAMMPGTPPERAAAQLRAAGTASPRRESTVRA